MFSDDVHLRYEGSRNASIGVEMSDIEENDDEDLGLGIDHSSDGEAGLVSDNGNGERPRSINNLDEGEAANNIIGEDGDDNAESNHPNATKVEPKKKRIKNPRPKLDLERLKGPRGLTALDEVFKDFKFTGTGREKEDLNALMLIYEHWAHRLFPIFKFDDCLDQLEHLGRKKEVQTLINKVRLGLHTTDDHVELFDDDDDDNPVQPVAVGNPVVPPDDIFDSLLEEARIQPPVAVPILPPSQPAPPVTLTPEQLGKIEANRLAAQAKRLARLKAMQEQSENGQ